MKYSKNSFSRFVPILLVVVITIVAIAAVITIGRSLLGNNQPSEQVNTVDEGKTALLSTDVSRSVRLTVRGPIVADEKFRSYQIMISPDTRKMVVYEGYLGKELNSKTLGNNAQAYKEFVHALDKRNMMSGKVLSESQNDLTGVCAGKKIYELETLVNGETVKKYWTSDCEGAKGSSLANVPDVITMFMNQIPGGKKMASDEGLVQQDSFFKL